MSTFTYSLYDIADTLYPSSGDDLDTETTENPRPLKRSRSRSPSPSPPPALQPLRGGASAPSPIRGGGSWNITRLPPNVPPQHAQLYIQYTRSGMSPEAAAGAVEAYHQQMLARGHLQTQPVPARLPFRTPPPHYPTTMSIPPPYPPPHTLPPAVGAFTQSHFAPPKDFVPSDTSLLPTLILPSRPLYTHPTQPPLPVQPPPPPTRPPPPPEPFHTHHLLSTRGQTIPPIPVEPWQG